MLITPSVLPLGNLLTGSKWFTNTEGSLGWKIDYSPPFSTIFVMEDWLNAVFLGVFLHWERGLLYLIQNALAMGCSFPNFLHLQNSDVSYFHSPVESDWQLQKYPRPRAASFYCRSPTVMISAPLLRKHAVLDFKHYTLKYVTLDSGMICGRMENKRKAKTGLVRVKTVA